VTFDGVVKQSEIPDANVAGGIRYSPSRTAVSIAYLDLSMSRLMERPKIILGPERPDGSVYPEAQRSDGTTLVEGGHVTVRYAGKPVMSMAEVLELRRAGKKLTFQMLFSAGQYFENYGSFYAYSFGGLEGFVPVLNEQGRLDNITGGLDRFFYAAGRPVSYINEKKQERILWHASSPSWLPEGASLEHLPSRPYWGQFRREPLEGGIERYWKNGVQRIRLRERGTN
jgi:hypothetical protein